MSALISIGVLFAIGPIAAFWRAYVIVTMWAWFVTPAYGYSAPTIYITAGVICILSLAMPVKATNPKNDDRGQFERAWDTIGFAFLFPGAVLIGAWIWKWLQWGVA